MSRSGSLFLASALALTASIVGACGEAEPDPGEAEAAATQPGAAQVIAGQRKGFEVIAGELPATQVIAGERPGFEVIAGERPGFEVIAGERPGFEVIAGELPDDAVLVGGSLRLDGVEVIARQRPDDAQVIGGLRPASILDPGIYLDLPGVGIIGSMLPRTATPVRLVPSLSHVQLACVDGGKQLVVGVNVHGQVDSAFIELHDGDAADAVVLDQVMGLPLVDHGHVVYSPDFTFRYATIGLDGTSPMRCDRLEHITAKAVVKLKGGLTRCLVEGEPAPDQRIDRSCL